MRILAFLLLLSFTSLGGWSQEIVVYNKTETKSKEALIILPGFGDSKKGRKEQKRFFKKRGYDLYIPVYKDGKSLDNCVSNLESFYEEMRLKDYHKIHVFSYIVGSWTLNRFIQKNGRRNIATIVYDRSPTQERAPYIANKYLGLLVRLKGLKKIMEEMAITPYPTLNSEGLSIGILIESKATPLMRAFKKKTLKMGPLLWDLKSLHQNYTDYHYTWLNHDQMYDRFDVIGKEVLSFIKEERFTSGARREKYQWDPFVPHKKEGLK